MAKKKKTARSSEIEQELKLQLSARDLEKVFAALRRQAIGKKIDHKYLPRAYYDSRDLALYRHNISVRIQYKQGKEGKVGGYEQTVKFDLAPEKGVVAGAFFRKECKDPIGSHLPSLAKISDKEGRAVARAFRTKRLNHIFTAAIERRSFELRAGRGKKRGLVEIAFDMGEIIIDSNRRRYPFSEIEIEMIEGHPDAIHEVAYRVRQLARSAKLQPLSKAQQGSRLYRKTAKRK